MDPELLANVVAFSKIAFLASTAEVKKSEASSSSSATRPAYVKPVSFLSSRVKHIQKHLVVESSSNRTLGSTLLIHKVHEVFLSSTTFIVNAFLVALGEELDRREGADAVLGREGTVVLRVGVDIRDEAL